MPPKTFEYWTVIAEFFPDRKDKFRIVVQKKLLPESLKRMLNLTDDPKYSFLDLGQTEHARMIWAIQTLDEEKIPTLVERVREAAVEDMLSFADDMAKRPLEDLT